MTSAADREARLDAVLGEFLLAVDAGNAPDPAQLMAQHPDLASDLRHFFESQEAFERSAKPLERRAEAVRTANPGADQTGPIVTSFGDYEILEKIGQGGMGTVYRARQKSLQRLVALKIVRGDKDLLTRELARFRNEAETAARLDHPNIVPILEVGDHQGQLYFTMKLIPGGSLAERLAGYREHPRQAACLVALAARAVHHAHQRGVLHRDLKPSNVLLQEWDAQTSVADAPGSPPRRARQRTEIERPDFSPIITDFGLALRLEGDSDLTQTGTLLGTPSYMAPEQTTTERGKATTATDVYGLGAILYAALTGQPPFTGATPLDTMLLVRDQEPTPPRSLNPQVDRDLEIICLKCLRKDPAGRYHSAEELALDLDHYLAGEPIAARPPTRWERGRRWARRRPALASALGVALVAALVLAAAAAWHTDHLENELDILSQALRRESKHQEQETKERERQARQSLYAANVHSAFLAWKYGETLQARQLLAHYDPKHEAEDWRDFEWYFLWEQCRPRELIRFAAHQGPIGSLAFTPDGKHLVTAATDQTVKVWDAATGKNQGTLTSLGQSILSLHFLPTEPTLVIVGERSIFYWDTRGRQPNRTKNLFAARLPMAVSRDGKWLVGETDRNGTIQAKNIDTDAVRQTLEISARAAYAHSISPDDKTILTRHGPWLRWWSVASGKELGSLEVHMAGERDSFAPNGRIVGFLSNGSQATLWRLDDLKTTVLPGAAEAMEFSPDGKSLACVSTDHRVSLWDHAALKKRLTLGNQGEAVQALAFSPDGRLLASADKKGTVVIWDASLPQAHQSPDVLATTGVMAFAPDGKTLALARADHAIALLDPQTGDIRATLPGSTGPLRLLAFAPDSQTLAAADAKRAIRLWNTRTGKARALLTGHAADITGLAFSADGKWLVSADRKCHLKIWDAATAQEQHALSTSQYDIKAIAVDPCTNLVAVASADGVIQLRELPSGKEVRNFKATPTADAVAFTHHGSKLAVATIAGVRLVDSATGKDLGLLPDSEAPTRSLSFSPDDRLLAGAGGRTFVCYWDVPSRSRVKGTGLPDIGGARNVAFAPDGRTAVTANGQGVVFFWDVKTWRARKLFPQPFREPVGLGFTQSGRLITGMYFPKAPLRSYLWGLALDQACRGVGEDLISFWDPANGRRLATLGEPPDTDCRPFAFTPSGMAAAGTSAGSAWVWDSHGQRLAPFFTSKAAEQAYNRRALLLAAGVPAIAEPSEPVHSLTLAEDGKTLVVLGWAGNLKVWDIASHREKVHVDGTFLPPLALASDGKTLAIQSKRDEIVLVDVAEGRPRENLQLGDNRIACLAFSPTGPTLAAGTFNGTIAIWNLTTHAQITAIPAHGGPVMDLAFSPSGQTIASAGTDRKVRLWHAATGTELLTLETTGPAYRACFSPDGQLLAATMGLLQIDGAGDVWWWRGPSDK